MENYYVFINGKEKGPLDASELKKYKIEALLFGVKKDVTRQSKMKTKISSLSVNN